MKNYTDGVFCTAGINYFVIAPNGDVFYCMADLESNRTPAFNLLNGWTPSTTLAKCPHSTCSGCDVPYVTRWFQDSSGETQNRVVRQWLNMVPETAERPQTIAKSITWLPTQMCNFTCVYCDYGNGKAFTNTRYPMSKGELSVEQWLNVWSQIMEHVDYASVTISGGEPTLAAAFYPVIEFIGSKYLINMTTNGSQPLLRLARQVPTKRMVPHRVFGKVDTGLDQINMSLHPSSKNFHEMTFKGNALMLKNAGFNVMINFVGYPPQLYLAREYKEWCEQNDLQFMLLEWGHGDRLGNSPSYSPRERAYLVSLMNHDRRVNAAETPVTDHTLNVETTIVRISRFGHGSVRGSATNKSQFAWKRGEPLGVKIGARIYGQLSGDKADWRSMSQSKRGDLVCELRCPLQAEAIEPTGCTSFEFNIRGEDFKPGFYTVVVDVVDEGKYWFADLGTMPASVILQIV